MKGSLRRSARRARSYAGFTLIEVVIVVAVLGILTGTVLLAVGNQASNAAVAACKADAKSLETALDEYRSDNNGAYPTDPNTGMPPYAPVSTDPTDPAWKLLLQPQPGFAGSPFMRDPIPTTHYVVWWVVDSTGQAHIYVYKGVPTSGLPFTYLTSSSTPPLGPTMDFVATGGTACTTYAK